MNPSTNQEFKMGFPSVVLLNLEQIQQTYNQNWERTLCELQIQFIE